MKMGSIKEKTKFDSFQLRGQDNSGIILLVVLWIMTIISILAIGLGRRTSIDVALTEHAIGKLKSDAAAWAGVTYAMDRIKKDTLDSSAKKLDIAYNCGFMLDEDETPEGLFKGVQVGENYFDISFHASESDSDIPKVIYGFQDEESKININAVTQQSYKVLTQLIILLGASEEDALTISSSIVDWYDTDANVTNSSYGAEEEFYSNLGKPYYCKNLPFDSTEELLLVKGMTTEIFAKLKDYITVFPKSTTRLLINPNTASELALRALGRSVAGQRTNTEMADADSMAQKIIAYRRGGDGEEFTSDDRQVDLNELGLNAKERSIYLASRGRMTNISRYLRVHIEGTEPASSAKSNIEVIISRDDLSITYWHKD